MTKPTLQIKQQQVKKLAELGAYLRQFRNEQAVTLEEVAAKTKIQARLLNAIEEGRFDELPESVYVQGFIRRYADALGLDGAQFATAFPTEPLIHAGRRSSWRELPAAQLRPIHLYVLYLLLIVGAVSGLSYLVNRPSSQFAVGNDAFLQSDIETSYRAEFPPRPSANKNPASPSDPSIDKSVRVGVTLTAQSWLRVVADGKTEYEGILDEGTQRTWAADKQLVLRAGNAGAVLVVVNDGKAKQLGAPGVVEEVTFSSSPSKSAQASNLLLNSQSAGLTSSSSAF